MSDNVLRMFDRRTVEKEASEWIVRFEGDEQLGPSDIDSFKAWVAQSAMHKKIITEYVSLWGDMDLLSELMLSTPAKRRQASSSSLNSTGNTAPAASWWGPVKVWGSASAALVLSVAVMMNLYLRYIDYPSMNGVYVTRTGETQSLTLSDNSVIWLNTDSRIEVDYNSVSRRITLLQGEAHFEVTKNANLAFKVFVGDKMVEAVGTAFSVHKKDKFINVIVTEGRVDLAAPTPFDVAGEAKHNNLQISSSLEPSDDAHIEENLKVMGSLDAGQSIELPLNKAGSMGDLEVLDQREINQKLLWREGLLVFSGEPLQEVIQEVSRYSNIHITISDPKLRSMRIGGQFRIGETDALFDVLENGFGLQVSRLGVDRVDIQSRVQQ